ncbi:ABC transporter substrate-binding protein [Paenibacillus guangzhouensis]|uniref:ABC transporter substrate-binding protein n=1 Tax=Paenibacillus guangzhouensis TaxID=1473112 RepID=UPI00187B65E1|nr:ABC transporter substrate-binding protein [Paenibacillus guangzhouensis]
MEVEAYFVKLREHYADIPEKQAFLLSMDDLTGIWDCTRRNAQLVLRRMEDHGYVTWQAGRGRGNLSSLTFRRSYRDVFLHQIKSLVLQEHIHEAWRLLDSYEDQNLQDEVTAWIASQFGVRQDLDAKDVLRFPFYRPVLDLDPAHVIRRTEAHWMRQIFNTLVSYSAREQQIEPKLAHAWECDASKKRWTFYLRKGIRFHHGKRMTARDVAYTFRRIQTAAPLEWIPAMIERMTVISDYCIEFQLYTPNAIFDHFICTERYSIVPEDHDERGDGNLEAIPVGTGPFRLIENNESKMVLESYEHYFEGCPHLDRIEMWVWPNYDGDLLLQVKDREAQLLYNEAPSTMGAKPSLRQVEKGSCYLTFNLARTGILQDIQLRQAIHVGLDRAQMLADLGGHRMCPAGGFIPEQDERPFHSEYDLAYAMELVRTSSYQGERLTLYTYEMISNEQSAAWIQEACARIGIQLDVVVVPIRELASREVLATADLVFAGEVLGEQPDMTLMEMYTLNTSFIGNHLSPAGSAVVDQGIAACLLEEKVENRLLLLHGIEEALKQQLQVLFLYHNIQTASHHPSLGGITLNAWGKVDYRHVWVRRK